MDRELKGAVLLALSCALLVTNSVSASTSCQVSVPPASRVKPQATNIAFPCVYYTTGPDAPYSGGPFTSSVAMMDFLEGCNASFYPQYSFVVVHSNQSQRFWDFYEGTTFQFQARVNGIDGDTICPFGYNLSGNGLCYASNPNSNVCPDEDDRLDPQPPQPDEEYCPVGNPVDPATGNKFHSEVDYIGSGPFPLSYVRYYNKNNTRLGASRYGAQWLSNYGRAILPDPYPASLTSVRVLQATGGLIHYKLVSGTWMAPSGKTQRLETITDVSGAFQGWRLYNDEDEIETYDTQGKLVSIAQHNALAHTLTYVSGRLSTVTDSFGHTLQFTYDGNGRVETVVNPAGTAAGTYRYAYDGNGNLITVTYPDNAARRYHYENSAHPKALTGITDEGNTRFATYEYYPDGRVKSTEHANGVERTVLTYDDSTGSASVQDALSATRKYTFTTVLGRVVLDNVTQPGCTSCGSSTSRTYDANGFPDTSTDFNGNVTTYVHNARGLEESRIEAYGSPLARTISTQWHATYRLPLQIDEPGRRTTYTYDGSGNRRTETVLDTTTLESRNTTWTYTSFGLVDTVDGPRTDVSDVTDYDYDTSGNLTKVTNALGQITQITSHDAHGNPLTIVDPNGVVTVLAYDLRQRLKTRTVGGKITTFDYDGVGQLDRVTLPGGAYLDYGYDAAHRLTDIQDNLGNKIHYTLDALGNRTDEEVRDPANDLKRKQSQVFDALGRLYQVKNANAAVVTQYAYDAQGNRTSQIDYSTPSTPHTTTFTPDALNRIKQVTDAAGGVTEYDYNALDQLTSVTDPKTLITSYVLNALGDLSLQQSPDTNGTSYTVDAAGNRLSQTDERGVTVHYAYALSNPISRIDPTGLESPTVTLGQFYDCGNGSSSESGGGDGGGTPTDYARVGGLLGLGTVGVTTFNYLASGISAAEAPGAMGVMLASGDLGHAAMAAGVLGTAYGIPLGAVAGLVIYGAINHPAMGDNRCSCGG